MIRFLISIGLIFILVSATGQQEQTYYDVSYDLTTPTGVIKGTLTSPAHPGHPPLAIIIAGSGPTDRNGNSPLGVTTDSYLLLANALATKGIPSIRFDKRGIAESKSAATTEGALRFDTYVDDVIAWVNHFKDDVHYDGVFLIGHSEGSLIGMIAAQKVPVKGYISISGAGRPADQILLEQLASLPADLYSLVKADIDTLKSGGNVTYVNPKLYSFFRPSVQEYLKSWMKYDPAREIKKLTVPILIIQGTTDLQVQEKDARILSDANPDASLLFIENMNHILKDAPADIKANIATYKDPSLPLKQGLEEAIVQFIRAHSK